MKITKRQLRKIIKEAVANSQIQKGDKVMVSEDGLFRFAKTAPYTMRDFENKLHDALNKGTIGTVIMVAPEQRIRVDFGGTAFDVPGWMLEKV